MYICNNCNTGVPAAEGKCTACNIKLTPEGVTALSNQTSEKKDRDLDFSHRCTNCGDVLRNLGGKCNTCRYPISSEQLRFVPRAEVISIHSQSLAAFKKAAS